MTASLAPSPLISQQDITGAPLVGGLLFTYLTGSNTPAPTFTDAAGTVQNPNPIELNAYGQAQIWLSTATTYRFQLSYPGDGSSTQPPTSPIWTVDGISASTGVTSIGGVGGVITIGAGLQVVGQQLSATIYRGYIAGLQMASSGSTTTFSVAAGQAVDSTNAAIMALPSALNKTTSAWAAGTGNGSLDTGVIANSTTYHAYLIQNPSTGSTDILTSLSATSPTLPPTYTIFRRIGAMITNGAAQWLPFTQVGDEFRLTTPPADINATITTTTPTLRALTIPSGITVTAIVAFNCSSGSGATNYGALSAPSTGGLNAGVTTAQVVWSPTGGTVGQAMAMVWSNTSSQIYAAVSSASSTTIQLSSQGWIDRRNRDA